jgi:predicted DNA-binding transcriptional regulator AlpA
VDQSIEDVIKSLIYEAVSAAEKRIMESINSQPDRALDIPEAALHLGISEQLLYRMCRAQQIPHERYGVSGSKRPTIKFRMSDLEVWRAEQRASNYKSS